jgi:hypothetical protein
MVTLHRLLELAGLYGADHMTHEQEELLRCDPPGPADALAAWIRLQGRYRLCEVDFHKLEKLRTLANHPNTPPHEKAAALAAIRRLLPPRPPEPDVPEGGFRSGGKVFRPGPEETDDTRPTATNRYTVRGKTFA